MEMSYNYKDTKIEGSDRVLIAGGSGAIQERDYFMRVGCFAPLLLVQSSQISLRENNICLARQHAFTVQGSLNIIR